MNINRSPYKNCIKKGYQSNLLHQYGTTIKYKYNHKGVRFRKELGDEFSKDYFLDGNRILGEDWTDGTKIRYFYNAEGIAGIRYQSKNFNFIRDGLGNVSKVMHRGKLIAEYNYDAWGNCLIQYLGTAPERDIFVVENNPFRWKGHYCDLETGLYYIDGRYYSPELMQYLDADSPENILANAYILNALDRNAITVYNPISFSSNLNNIFTSVKLYSDVGSSVSDSNWLGDLFNWYNNLHWGWKVGIGAVVIGGLAIATVATGGATGSAAGFVLAGMTKGALIGAGTGALFGVAGGLIGTAISEDWDNLGNNILNKASSGFALGSITGAISGGISRAHTLSNWNPGKSGSSFKEMWKHYNKHVIKEGLNVGRLKMGLFGGGMVNYTKDGIALWANYGAQAVWKTYMRLGAQDGFLINMKVAGAGKGLYDVFGRIIYFLYV